MTQLQERLFDLQDFAYRAFQQKLIPNIDPETIIGVASHGGAMRYFLYAFGYGPHKMPNTALFHLIYDNGDWSLEQL